MSQEITSLKDSKGVGVMNTKTRDELKELRKEIIEQCRGFIGRGYTYKMKIDALCTLYGVSTRQAKTYIKYTREDITKRKQEHFEKEYDEVLIKLDTLYREMFSSGNLVGAAKVLDQLIKLRGYEAPKLLMVKQEVQVKQDFSHYSEAELLQLNALLSKSKD